MVKTVMSHNIDSEVVKDVEKIRDKDYPGASRSYVVEILLKEAVSNRKRRDASVA